MEMKKHKIAIELPYPYLNVFLTFEIASKTNLAAAPNDNFIVNKVIIAVIPNPNK